MGSPFLVKGIRFTAESDAHFCSPLTAPTGLPVGAVSSAQLRKFTTLQNVAIPLKRYCGDMATYLGKIKSFHLETLSLRLQSRQFPTSKSTNSPACAF